MGREEIMYSWLRFIKQIVQNYYITTGKPVREDKLFQYRFPEPLWDNIETFIDNLKGLPLWVNHELSLSAFGGKRNYEYWQMIFETGQSPRAKCHAARHQPNADAATSGAHNGVSSRTVPQSASWTTL